MSTTQKKFVSACFFVLIMGLLLGQSLSPSPSMAGPELPPRHVPREPTPNDDDDDGGRVLVGAHIELHASGLPNGAWSVVQWLDTAGNWHDVEGWTATMPNTYQRHWVAPPDFGKGPFRWQVRRGPTGPVLAASDPFSLPLSGNEVVVVTTGK